MSDKSVVFRSRARNAGFTMMDNPVLRSRKLSAHAKIVWGLLCFFAREDESCWPGQDRLADEVPCSVSSLRGYIGELTTVGLVEVQRRGLGKTNLYVLGDLDGLATPGSPESTHQETQPLAPGSPDSGDQEQQMLAVPVETKTQGTKTEGNTAAEGRPCPTKVGTKKVGRAECELAWGVMDAFNATFGTKVSAKGFVEKIIRRHREHPELTLEDHVRVIRGVKAGRKWWSGTPDPAIIYGSDEQFERSLANAPSGPSESSVQSEGVQTDQQDWSNLDDVVRYD